MINPTDQPLLMVLGIRPDVIRASLMLKGLREALGDRFKFVWSGQHYSDNLKDVFFRQLGVTPPDIELPVDLSNDTNFIGSWVSSLGALMEETNPAACVFLGDTNTVLGTTACASYNVPVVHIEGCMRSYDWRMPEEKYRTVADHLSDLIYAYLDEYKNQGLLEGLDPRRIMVTGNPIVDVLEQYFISGQIRMSEEERDSLFTSVGADVDQFCVMTSHRRENVETEKSLRNIMQLAGRTGTPVVFPASYRTQKSLQRIGVDVPSNVRMIDPIGYAELLELMDSAAAVLTDSGTVVEETAVIGVPSIQMRSSTERPQVYDCGSSVKFDPHAEHDEASRDAVISEAFSRSGSDWNHGLGDGRASERIVADLVARMGDPESFRGHDPVGTNRPHDRNWGTGNSELGSAGR